MQNVKNASFAKAAAVLVAVLAFALSLCAVNTTSAFAQAAPTSTPNKSITVTVNKSTVADLSFTMDKEWAGKVMNFVSLYSNNTNITTLSLVSNQAIIGDDGTVVCYASVKAAHVGNYYATLTTRLEGATKNITIPLTIKVNKANSTITAKKTTATKSYKGKKKKLAAKKTITAAKLKSTFGLSAKTALTFKKTSGNSKITVAKAGKVTIKKGLKKGSYKVKIKVTSATTADYNGKTKTVTLTVKVK